MTREDQEQAKLIRWAELQENVIPELEMLYAIPNGGGRTKATAGILKATGTKKGVPDLCLAAPMDGYHGLYIELKTPATLNSAAGRTSPDQRKWLQRLNARGYQATVCYGFEEAKTAMLHYLGRLP